MLIQQSMLTLGYSEDGDQPLTETVKNEIETLRPMTAWLKFGAFYKLVNEQIECFILFCFILQVN